MIGITLIGLLFVYLAYLVESISLQHLWFLAISIVPCVSIPTIMSVYIDVIDSNWMFYGILVAIVFGMSTFFYSNVNNLIELQVLSSIFMIVSSSVITLIPNFKRFISRVILDK